MSNQTEPKVMNPVEKHLAKLSRYQLYVFFLLFLSKAPIFWHVLNLIFLSPPMDYDCSGTGTKSGNGSKNICPCEEPSWNRSVFTETMQTKFKILCENAWLVSFSQSMAYSGMLIGCFIIGYLSDRYGRLTTFSASCLVLAMSGCLISVMPTATTFTCMRFIEGIAVGGCIITSYVLCVEYCGVRQREIVTALFHIPLNIGHLTIPGVSYLLRDCDVFQLALSIPMFLFAALKFMMMESPKWLMDNNHINEAVALLKKLNPKSNEDFKSDIETYLSSEGRNTHRKLKIWEIFKHKQLSLNFGCMGFIYFVCGMGYYGVSQFIGLMSGNIHLNVAMSGLLLLPGTILCVFLLGVLSRRTFLMGTNLLAGIFIICCICVPLDLNWLRVLFACISNCCFFMSFITAFLYGVELFPTSVRSSVLGVLSVMSRIGQIVNPPINSLPKTTSGSIYGVMAILGGLLCFSLPETKNVELPSSLEDTKTISQRRKSNQAESSGQ